MKRTPSEAVARSLAALRRWLKDTWISRLTLGEWLYAWRARRAARPGRPRPKPPVFRADWLVFEPRWGPDDFTGLGGAPLVGGGLALLGNSLQLPVMAFARGMEARLLSAPTAPAARPSHFDYQPAEEFAVPPPVVLAGAASSTSAAASGGASAPQAVPPPAAQAGAFDDAGLDDWLNRVGALLDTGAARPAHVPASSAPIAPGLEEGGASAGAAAPNAVQPTAGSAAPAPAAAASVPAADALPSALALTPALVQAAQHQTATPTTLGRSRPSAGGGVQPNSIDALLTETIIYSREPSLTSTLGTPIDPGFAIDPGGDPDPLFPTVSIGNPDCGCGGGADGGLATVDPNTGNVALYQPLDFRQSQPGGANRADDFAHLAAPALVYNSNTVNVQPIGEIYPKWDTLPASIPLAVSWNGGAYGPTTTFQTTGHSAGDTYLLAGQYLPGSSLSSGLYSWTFKVNNLTYFVGDYPVIGNDNSPFGAGWSLSGLDHLYFNGDGSVMWAFGANASPAVWLVNPDTGARINPANMYGTLTQNPITLAWTYTSEHQVKYNFSSGGVLNSITDPHNLAITYTYSGTLLSTVKMPDGGVTTYSYNASNQLTLVSEPGSRALTFAYDASNNLTSTTDSDGSLRTYAYDANHKLTSVNWAPLTSLYSYGLANSAGKGFQTNPALNKSGNVGVAAFTDALNQVTTFTVDLLGYVQQVKTPDGATRSWTRNTNEKPTVYTDAVNRVTSYAYDTTRKYDLTQVTYADGTTSQYQYDTTFDWPTVRVDENGKRTTFSYDATTGDVSSVKDALGNLTSYTYLQTGGRSNGLLNTVKDPLGHVTTFQQDTALRRLTAVTNALNQTSTFTYDAAGNPATVKDALGHVTSYAYDARRRLTKTTDATGGITTVAYNSLGEVTQQLDPMGNSTTYAYDGKGLLTSETDAAGSSVSRLLTFAYDGLGRRTTATDGLNRTLTSAYDPVGRLTQTTNAIGGLATSVYDVQGQLQYQKDEAGTITSFAYDQRGRQTKVIEAYGSSVQRTGTMSYDAAGNVSATINPLGNRTTFSYDALNRQTQVKDALGGLATTVFDAAGNVSASVDPRGNRTTYSYDAVNRQTQVKDALGGLATTVYDAAGNTSATVDQLANRTTYSYDAANRQTQTQDALGGLATTVYDPAGKVSATVDQRGNRTTFSYDALNRRTQTKDALGNLATVIYDAADNVSAQVDPLGHRTTFAYDALNRQTTATNPLSFVSSTAYDAVSNVTETTNPRGYKTTFSYDALYRQTQTKDALGNLSTVVYDATDNVLANVDARGNRTTFAYDALNRQTQTTDALNHLTTVAYDAVGNVTKQLDALNNATTYAYDALNRQTSVQDPGTGIATTVYDAASNVTNVIDQLNHKTTYVYDALNRKTKTIDALGYATTVLYDAASNMTAVIDPVNNRTTFVYDALNRDVQETDAFNKSVTLAYDAAGRVTSTTDRLTRRMDYTFDNADRLTGETWVNAGGGTAQAFTYTYDNNNNQLTAANAAGTNTMVYDAIDRVTVVTEPFGVTLTLSYDAASNRTVVQDNFGGFITSTYDAANRLTSRQSNGGTGSAQVRIDLAYSVRDQVTTITRYKNLDGAPANKIGDSVYTYDAAMRLRNLQHRDASAVTKANYTYTYDVAHRVVTETYNGTNKNYSYDNTDQLTNDGTNPYSYDGNGNRTMTGYQTGTNNRMTNDGVYTYTYDDQGNLTKKSKGASLETWNYTFDHDNHLTGVEKHASDGGALQMKATYVYDALRNRVEKQVDADGSGAGASVTTRFAYDGGDVFADLDGSSSLTTRRIFLDGVDSVAARVASAVVSWYLPDRLGSIRNQTDASGVLSNTITYDGFGKVTAETNSGTGDRYKYTGREQDSESGLQFNRGRYYNPATGTWTSADPSGFAAGDPNLYRYVRNTPTNATDPSGLMGSRPNWQYLDNSNAGPRTGFSIGFNLPPATDQYRRLDLSNGDIVFATLDTTLYTNAGELKGITIGYIETAGRAKPAKVQFLQFFASMVTYKIRTSVFPWPDYEFRDGKDGCFIPGFGFITVTTDFNDKPWWNIDSKSNTDPTYSTYTTHGVFKKKNERISYMFDSPNAGYKLAKDYLKRSGVTEVWVEQVFHTYVLVDGAVTARVWWVERDYATWIPWISDIEGELEIVGIDGGYPDEHQQSALSVLYPNQNIIPIKKK